MDPTLAIQLITAGLNAIGVITDYINKVKSAAQQSGRLTADQQKTLDDLIANAPKLPNWQQQV